MCDRPAATTSDDPITPGHSGQGAVAADQGAEPMDAEHRRAVAIGWDQIRRGEIASDDEIQTIFRSFGL